MFSLVDKYIRGLGYSQSNVNDRVYAFLKDQTGLDTTTNDMAMNFLSLEGFTLGTTNDRFNAWLRTKAAGVSIATNDLAHNLNEIFPASNLVAYIPLRSNLDLVTGTGTATFTRASTATFVDPFDGLVKTAATNIPRFEQNGVLIEGASTNLLLRSEEFNNGSWTKSGASVMANTIAAPDGALTADKLVESSGTGQHSFEQAATVTLTNTYTLSAFVKPDERDIIKFFGFGNGATGITFDFANLTVQINGTWLSGRIEVLTNGWFRCSGVVQPISSGLAQIGAALTAGGATYTGDGVSGLFIWGAELEELPFASSYIPTVASTVTKTLEDNSISSSNIPAPTADYSVCIVIDAIGFDSSKSQVLFNVDGETSRRIQWNTTTGAIEAIHGAVTSTSTSTFSAGDSVNICFTVGTTNQTLYINGVQEDQDVKGTVTGTATSIDIGNQAGINQAFSHIKDLQILDKEATPTEAKVLS